MRWNSNENHLRRPQWLSNGLMVIYFPAPPASRVGLVHVEQFSQQEGECPPMPSGDLSRNQHPDKVNNRRAITSCEITKASIYLLAAWNVFQNVSHPASSPHCNRITRIELSIVEIEL